MMIRAVSVSDSVDSVDSVDYVSVYVDSADSVYDFCFLLCFCFGWFFVVPP